MYWNYQDVNELLHIDRIYSHFEKVYDPPYTFTGESHDFWECVYVMEGEICVSADESIYYMKEGEVVCHAPLEFHKWHVTGDKRVHLLILTFSLEGELQKSLNQKIVSIADKEKIILDLLIDHNRTSDHNSEDFLQILQNYIQLLLLNFAKDNSIHETATDFDSVIYKKAVCYMSDNIHRKISTEEIAKHCNVGTTFLKNIFKKYSGLSIHKYFLKMQMRNASELLDSGKSVTEVAEILGFCSQPYFSAAFKREFGYPPTEFRKVGSQNSYNY